MEEISPEVRVIELASYGAKASNLVLQEAVAR